MTKMTSKQLDELRALAEKAVGRDRLRSRGRTW